MINKVLRNKKHYIQNILTIITMALGYYLHVTYQAKEFSYSNTLHVLTFTLRVGLGHEHKFN